MLLKLVKTVKKYRSDHKTFREADGRKSPRGGDPFTAKGSDCKQFNNEFGYMGYRTNEKILGVGGNEEK